VEKDRDALWLVQALENSRGIALAWLAKDSEEALLYLRGQDIYANRAKFPEPNLVIVNSTRRDATQVLKLTCELPDPPAIVQLTAGPDVSGSLKAMGVGADCCQPKPRSLGETIALVDWLEGWLPSIAGPLDADNILAFPGNFGPRDVPQLVSAQQNHR
jgi:DNA-binding response OmpR family regulator